MFVYDKKIYNKIAQINASEWYNLDSEKIKRFIVALTKVEQSAKFFNTSCDCKNLIREMQRTIKAKESQVELVEVK